MKKLGRNDKLFCVIFKNEIFLLKYLLWLFSADGQTIKQDELDKSFFYIVFAKPYH
jgi:hypothetical protein